MKYPEGEVKPVKGHSWIHGIFERKKEEAKLGLNLPATIVHQVAFCACAHGIASVCWPAKEVLS